MDRDGVGVRGYIRRMVRGQQREEWRRRTNNRGRGGVVGGGRHKR